MKFARFVAGLIAGVCICSVRPTLDLTNEDHRLLASMGVAA
jgi:hypothetical protein